MAKKKRSTSRPQIQKRDAALVRYEQVFGQVQRFIDTVGESEKELLEAEREAADAKEKYDQARDRVNVIRDRAQIAKHSLFRYLQPSDGGEVLPLFDRMESADEELHGFNAAEWRADPIASLRLPLPTLIALSEADVLLVGQLQDRIIADEPCWFESIAGLTASSATAISNQLNDFVREKNAVKPAKRTKKTRVRNG